jgi:predicted acylesterase/phospholipase RssA
MSDKFQFVFQGGGAKLSILMAAAEAVYAQKAANNFSITRVSGTSAGAIVACMLATGENPALFRQQLEVVAKDYLGNIISQTYSLNYLRRLWVGDSIYNSHKYKEFLRKLFDLTTKSWEYLRDLEIEVFINAVDIYTRHEISYTKDSPISIADALFDSSALPFIFRTYKDTSSIVDGGVTNNFPVDVLQKGEDIERYGRVIGFSFAPEHTSRRSQKITLTDFAGAVISTMMDVSSQKALNTLPKGDVHYFNTVTSTLDWERGIKNLQSPIFNGYFEDAKRFIDDVVTRYRITPEPASEREMHKRILELHRGLQNRQGHIKVTRVTLTYTCNALRERNPNRVDDVHYVVEIASVSNPIHTFGVRITVDYDKPHGADAAISVLDADNNRVETTVIPISPKFLDGQVPDNNFVLFFHQPLMPGATYRIDMSAEAREVMYELCQPPGRDVVSYRLRNMDEVEEVNVCVLLPTSITRPSISQATDPLPAGIFDVGKRIAGRGR